MTLSKEDISKTLTGGAFPGGDDNAVVILSKLQTAFGPHIENIFSTLTGQELKVDIKSEESTTAADFPAIFTGEWMGYTGVLDIGAAITTGHLLSMGLAKDVAGKIMGQETPATLDEAQIGALKEAANNLLGAWATGLGEMISVDVKPSGEVNILEGEGASSLAAAEGIAGEELTAWRYAVSIGDADGEYVLVLPTKHLKELVMKHPEYAAGAAAKQGKPYATPDIAAKKGPAVSQVTKPEIEVEKAVFQAFEGEAPAGEPSQIDLLLDVPLTVSVELGRKRLSIKEILDMVPGSLLELDKLAGEPVELMVNGKLFARGEVVVIDENFGVRIANIVSPKERLERLK